MRDSREAEHAAFRNCNTINKESTSRVTAAALEFVIVSFQSPLREVRRLYHKAVKKQNIVAFYARNMVK